MSTPASAVNQKGDTSAQQTGAGISHLYSVEFRHGSMSETLYVGPDPHEAANTMFSAMTALEDQAPAVTEIVLRRTAWYCRSTPHDGD